MGSMLSLTINAALSGLVLLMAAVLLHRGIAAL